MNDRDVMKYNVGDRVKFIGYRTVSFDLPSIQIGSLGTVSSVRKPNQRGYDYWVKLDSGSLLAFDQSELDEA